MLRALEELGYEPVAFSACSSGAIIGAFYAAGYRSNRIRHVLETSDFLSLIDPDSGSGLLKLDKVADFLGEHLPYSASRLVLSRVS